MTSPLQEIADTLAIEFRDAVIDAEKQDMATIEKIIQDLNTAVHDYDNREKVLNTQAEQALRTLQEITELRDVNAVTYNRRIEALREQLKEFRDTKITAKNEALGNVVRLEKMVEKA